MAQQTAVEYLMNELKNHLEIEWPMNIWLRKKLEQAKQMEKEQIVDAHYQGYRNDIGTTEVSEKYYNETYES